MAISNEVATSGLLNLEKELVCFICTEILYQPLTLLDCLHTFCGSCLKEWFSYQHKKAAKSRSVQTSNPYTCPTCRATVKDARHNATVSTLLDMFLSANPDRGKPADEKAELAKVYKPGEDILPKVDPPRRHDRRSRRAEEAAEEADRRQLEEARERSLRELRGRGPEHHNASLTAPGAGSESGRSRSRESRDRDARRERRREQERLERRRRAEAAEASHARGSSGNLTEDHATTNTATLSLPTTSPRHPEAVEARSNREIVHQASLRSMVSASESGTGTGDSLNEARIMQEILSQGLLEGIDLSDLNAAQEDELSERIAQAYRQRHQRRDQDSLIQNTGASQNATRGITAETTSDGVQQGMERQQQRRRSVSSQPAAATEARRSVDAANSRLPPVSRPHLLEPADNNHPPSVTSAHRRRASDQSRRRTSPDPQNGRNGPDSIARRDQGTRSVSDLSNRPQVSDAPPNDRIRLLSNATRTNTEPGQSSNISDVWFSGSAETTSVRVGQTQQLDSSTPLSQPGVTAAKGTNAGPDRRHTRNTLENRALSSPPHTPVTAQVPSRPSPRSDHSLPTLTKIYYTEPSISCNRCSRPNIQYELHKHCSRCVMDVCLPCYRASRGCNHWFGFGITAQYKFEASHPGGRGSQLIELPHVLVGRKYLRPSSPAITDNAGSAKAAGAGKMSTSDPATRLQEGKFCDRCHSFANACFWACDYCNEGEWGFCNKCVNTHHCCTHPLLPMSHQSFAPKSSKSQRLPGYDPAKGALTITPNEFHASVIPANPHDRPLTPEPTAFDGTVPEPEYLQLAFTTNCDICASPIQPSESRFHCPEHPSPSRQENDNKGDYDICRSCYVNLVKLGKIKREDGPAGWRKCPSGHRMITVEFDDRIPQLQGHRRIVINDLVGGHRFTAADIATFATSSTVGPPENLPSATGQWSWKENSEGKRSSRTRALTQNLKGSKFPPDGGYGKRCVGRWSYYPEEGEGGKNELLFPKGAEIREIEDINEEWYFGVYAGEKGLLPAPYVWVLDP